jgi:hypothetical protein
MVDDTARRADDQPRLALEGHKLRLHIGSADEQNRPAQRMVARQFAQNIQHLHREFAGGRHDDGGFILVFFQIG